MGKLLTTEEFIKRAKEIHKDNYSYSEVIYSTSKNKVKIFCKICKKYFLQTPSDHYRCGCPYCKGKKLKKEEIIAKCNKIHNFKYDYSLVNYRVLRDKVKIICPTHGIFEQDLTGHMQGTGCNLCGIEITRIKERYTKEQVIKKAIKVHGNLYNYELLEYFNCKTPVKIICSIHGIFETTTDSHINRKTGCPKCAGKNRTSEDIIKMFQEKHDNLYDYSLVEYKTMHTKVKIICEDHGVFEMTPSNHFVLNQGCPKCKSSKGEKKIRRWLKKNNIKFEEQKLFDDCKGKKRSMPMDFFLPYRNICIEYDGEFHHLPIRYSSMNEKEAKERLEKQQKRDQIKNKYCKERGIKLLRIPYTEFDNIETILEKEIKEAPKRLNLFTL